MYQFENLSPIDFEELVRDLLQAEVGIHLESFSPGKDKGIDCRFASGPGVAVVQAKHYARSGPSKLLRTLANEVAKVRKLKPKRYFIGTSVSLTPTLKDQIISVMAGVPLASADILGLEDLNNLLGKYPHVEKKHFKLWLGSSAVLERLLHSGMLNRTETELELIRLMIPRFVQNGSVDSAESILSQYGTLIIAGDPGVGKTTLARMLVSLHASQEWNVSVVDDMAEAFKVANAGERRLIFFDDFLGQVRLSSDHVRGIDQRLPPFLARVKSNKNLRFILTTREYILSQAQLLSSRLATRDLLTTRYVLNVGVYTRSVRARILYNHLYFSDLNNSQIMDILSNKLYLRIIDHPNFNPRLISLLSSEEYVQLSGESLTAAIQRILDNPDQLWELPYRDHISADGRALMLALLLNRSAVAFDTLKATYIRTAMALGRPVRKAEIQSTFSAALKELEGSVLSIVERTVRFSNPGVRDFLSNIVITDILLPSLVPCLETYDEVKEAWSIFVQSKVRFESLEGSDWSDVLARVQNAKDGETLARYDLAQEQFRYFGCETFLPTLRCIIDDIENEGFDARQLRAASSALEMVQCTSHSSEDLTRFHEVLTVATADILTNYGDELSFDDIRALDSTLFTYGSNTQVAEAALNAALTKFIPYIDNELENFDTLEELDEFETILSALMADRKFSGPSPKVDLQIKRRKLEEDEPIPRNRTTYTAGNHSLFPSDVSDADLQSLFGSLNDMRRTH